jgi:zinc transport system substrate-binding protein
MKIRFSLIFGCLIGIHTLGPADASAAVRVVTSLYPLYVAALNVTEGIEGVEVSNLAGSHAGCLHDYQLTTADARRLAQADLFLANGAGMETFLDKVRAQNPKLEIVDASRGAPLLDGNPHVWVSPKGARLQVDNIARALSAADPAQTARYAANAASYNAKLSGLEEQMKTALAPFAGAPVVTMHEAFPYFAEDFRLDIVGVIEREPGHEPGARELARTVDLVRAKKVKLILAEPQYSDRAARTIARETGAEVCQLDPVVTGPSEPDAARSAYLRAMEKNLAVLRQALRR